MGEAISGRGSALEDDYSEEEITSWCSSEKWQVEGVDMEKHCITLAWETWERDVEGEAQRHLPCCVHSHLRHQGYFLSKTTQTGSSHF